MKPLTSAAATGPVGRLLSGGQTPAALAKQVFAATKLADAAAAEVAGALGGP